MSWGVCYFYYRCPQCGEKFKCAEDMIPTLGDRFGYCPRCGCGGVYEKDGACTIDDMDYREAD